jgi:hypothetical protein
LDQIDQFIVRHCDLPSRVVFTCLFQQLGEQVDAVVLRPPTRSCAPVSSIVVDQRDCAGRAIERSSANLRLQVGIRRIL